MTDGRIPTVKEYDALCIINACKGRKSNFTHAPPTKTIGAEMGAVGCRYHATESASKTLNSGVVDPRKRPVHLQLPLLHSKSDRPKL